MLNRAEESKRREDDLRKKKVIGKEKVGEESKQRKKGGVRVPQKKWGPIPFKLLNKRYETGKKKNGRGNANPRLQMAKPAMRFENRLLTSAEKTG